MILLDSRRITGPHWLLDGPGAAVEVRLEPALPMGARGPGGSANQQADTIADWEARARRTCDALGWPFQSGARTWTDAEGRPCASLALRAPPDLLETACLVAEAACVAPGDPRGPRFADVAALRAREAHPLLRRLLAAAEAAGLPCFHDDDGLTVGLGPHARTWGLDALPSAIFGEGLGSWGGGPAPRNAPGLLGEPPSGSGSLRVPIVLVTGTNGKTTTTRLLARIARAAGFVAGHTSSDAIVVDGQVVDTGDWSGPGAARRLLRDARVGFAVLETARGGLLRRGLAIGGAEIAVVTNVSNDHFGEYGIDDLDAMADAKLSIAAGVRPGGTLVVNAGCAPLMAGVARLRARRPDLVVRAFTPPADPAAPGAMLTLDGEPLLPIADIPLTLAGLAGHNVENALAAATAARAVGIAREAIAEALRSFAPSPSDSPGRTNLLRRCAAANGADVLLDFAHNPDGLARLAPVITRWPAARRLLVFGTSGDRTDAIIDDLGRVAAELGCDRYVVKELPGHLRGRAPGEVPDRLHATLVARGVAEAAVARAGDDLEATEQALAWARAGDLVVLLVHEETDAVVARLAGA
jgi:cyanophycin synthetase